MAVNFQKLIDLDLLAYFKSKLDLLFAGKVDKENGKGLSSNDYTSAEKTKLSGIAEGAQVNVLEGIQKNGTTVSITNKIANITVPTKTSDITNDSGFITSAAVPTATSTTPKMDGTAAVGTETTYAKGDHVHPHDTTKVDKVDGKGLSTNDYTTNEKNKLAGIAAGAEVNVQSDWNQTTTTADDYIKNKPSIPAATSELTNDSGFITSADVPVPTTSTPKMDGTAAKGTETAFARGDHVHPSDTTKVDKIDGKGLSTNDYTTAEKNKLGGIAAGAEVNVQSDWNQTTTTADDYIKNKPSIPSKTSDLTNDSGFITSADVPAGVQPTTTSPKMDGTAAVGTETKYARGDHVHPSDTTKVDKVAGKGLSTNDYTTAEKNKLAGIAEGAEKNVVPEVQEDPTEPNTFFFYYLSGANTTSVADFPTVDWVSDVIQTFGNQAMQQIATSYYGKSEIDQMLVGAMNYKGTKATTSELPSSGNSQGDVWHITADGSEWAWNGSSWEELGTAIDLSGYVEDSDIGLATTSEIDALFEAAS